MLRFLASTWLYRRLAGPLSRAIPNPYVRAAAIAGLGAFATRVFSKRR